MVKRDIEGNKNNKRNHSDVIEKSNFMNILNSPWILPCYNTHARYKCLFRSPSVSKWRISLKNKSPLVARPKRPDRFHLSLVQLGRDISPSYLQRSPHHALLEWQATLVTHEQKQATAITPIYAFCWPLENTTKLKIVYNNFALYWLINGVHNYNFYKCIVIVVHCRLPSW